MTSMPGTKISRWSIALLAIVAAIYAGRVSVTGFAGSAKAANGMSPVDRLIAEDDIRQRLSLYALYADGDGVNPMDTPALAEKLMTPDVVSKSYPANGGPPRILNGRAPVAGTNPRQMPPVDRPSAGRHYLVQTYFDEVTPTTAKTRSTALYFDVTRNLVGPDCKAAGPDACGGKVVSSALWVYHMTWKKTADGWQIVENLLYDDT
jgi:hypothetical protein